MRKFGEKVKRFDGEIDNRAMFHDSRPAEGLQGGRVGPVERMQS